MQKSETSIEVKVGALVLFATVLLVTFVLVLGDFSFSEGFSFDVEFNNAGGLKPGADVAIAGINVGNVDKLRFIQNDKVSKETGAVAVRATLKIDEEYAEAVRENSEFFITTRGVLGEPYIEVVTKDFEKAPIKAGALLRGVDPPRMDIIVARATELLTTLNEIFDDPEIQTRELITNTASWMKSLDSLIVDNRQDLDATVDNVRDTSSEAAKLLTAFNVAVDDGTGLKSTLNSVERTARNADVITARVGRDIDPLMNDVGKIAGSAEATTASLERIVAGNEGKIGGAIDDLSASSTRLATITQDAADVVGGIKKGEGTVGALIHEREIYDDLREMLRNIKQRPWKIVWKE